MNTHANGETQHFDVVIVGAGFGGLYALYKLRKLGLRVQVLEAGDAIGGTWYWNRYPGARCDVESMQYSYSFSDEIQQEWEWSELYATQPEILRYINFVADKLDLRSEVQLNTRVKSAQFDEDKAQWQVETSEGQKFSAPYMIMATGCLSMPVEPKIDGLADFDGPILRTSSWPKQPVDLSGKRVGIIGTGSSGIQTIPQITAMAAQVSVFQRTPNYSIPARNTAMDADYMADWKQHYGERRGAILKARNHTITDGLGVSGTSVSHEEFEGNLEQRWLRGGIRFMYTYNDMTTNDEVNAAASAFIRKKIGEIVKDPETARKLTPVTYPLGAKRVCVDTGYYETFNDPKISLFDIKANPIKQVTKNAIVLADGETVEMDVMVLATGFDALTGALLAVDFTGKDGVKLSDEWAAGPKTYMGLMIAGFPNMFTVTGPQSPSVTANMVPAIEVHVDWIVDTIANMNANKLRVIDASRDAQEAWTAHSAEVGEKTVMNATESWYVGANIEGKPRVFMPYIGGADVYIAKLDAITRDDYSGFLRA